MSERAGCRMDQLPANTAGDRSGTQGDFMEAAATVPPQYAPQKLQRIQACFVLVQRIPAPTEDKGPGRPRRPARPGDAPRHCALKIPGTGVTKAADRRGPWRGRQPALLADAIGNAEQAQEAIRGQGTEETASWSKMTAVGRHGIAPLHA